MQAANWHTYPGADEALGADARARSRTSSRTRPSLPHIWWGVSVENRRHGLPRIDHLRDGPGRGPVPVGRAAARGPRADRPRPASTGSSSAARAVTARGRWTRDWVRSIRDQCARAGVPFFFKQWGGVRKAKAGRELDGRTHDDRPLPVRAAPPSAMIRKSLHQAFSTESG